VKPVISIGASPKNKVFELDFELVQIPSSVLAETVDREAWKPPLAFEEVVYAGARNPSAALFAGILGAETGSRATASSAMFSTNCRSGRLFRSRHGLARAAFG
jgi:hypothetical protein